MTTAPILIVDDDASQRRLIEFWLQEDGYRTVTAEDGKAGLRAFEQRAPALVITDVRMPGMSGLDLLGKIKGDNPDIPFILITAFATVDDAVEALKLGATDYILKPLKADEVKLSVRRTLEQKELVDENRRLREFAGDSFRFESILAQSRRMRSILEIAAQVARRDSTVLLTGESGTGKELLAKAIHQTSLRANKPFVTVNCGALPENLAESELFGHRKGSFTGAIADRAGKFESANEGTIFLDEVGELSLPLQVKLLRVIQEREIDKVGNAHSIKVNVRILAATNRNLKNLVEDGQFREDLYYRLSVVTIDVPPLRERQEDIPLLAQHFVKQFSDRYAIPGLSITEEALEKLGQYNWPGNVRELQNVIERVSVLARSNKIGVDELPLEVRSSASRIASISLKLPEEGIDLEQIEKEILLQALEKHSWNQSQAARYLNISRKTLIYRMEKFALLPPAPESST
ncbi:MAG: sigma-54-dependent Fis family transcriptional regulator [Acidobacteriota bacterium]|nr:sigma-54-dependent Fis family transcriptional regulator [Acidobacteriota bacterium]